MSFGSRSLPKSIRHWPPVPAMLNFLYLSFPSVSLTMANLKRRIERKRKPVARPPSACPVSCKANCITTATISDTNVTATLRASSPMPTSFVLRFPMASGPSIRMMMRYAIPKPITTPTARPSSIFSNVFIAFCFCFLSLFLLRCSSTSSKNTGGWGSAVAAWLSAESFRILLCLAFRLHGICP